MGIEQDIDRPSGTPVTIEGGTVNSNPISGQTGVAAGAGTVDAQTQRMTLASNDPAVVALQLIDDAVGATGATAPTKAALVGGTNAGNLVSLSVTASGGLVVGQVSPGSAAANLGKAVDDVAGATHTGVAALMKRVDSLGALTPANGDYTYGQVDSQGALWVRQSSTPMFQYSKARMSSATTTTHKSGPGILHGIIINKAVASGVITIYDNTAASGTIIGIITFGATLLGDPPIMALYDAQISTGITIVTSADFDLTVLYI